MEQLLEQERTVRLEGKTAKLEEIHKQILENCSSDEEIIRIVKQLVNKRRQDPQCIKKLIKSIFDAKKSIEFYSELLKEVIEGRIYLEAERVYICEYVKHECGNDIEAAYEAIRTVPVETFTTIKEETRNEFLFEQIRLAVLLERFEDAELTTRKIRQAGMVQDEKVIFYNYSIMLKIKMKKFLEAAALYTQLGEISPSTTNTTLGSIYAVSSSCYLEGNDVRKEKAEIFHAYSENAMNDPEMRKIVNLFNSSVIINETVIAKIKKLHAKYVDEGTEVSVTKALQLSILEHNLFAVQKYCSKIFISELCEMLAIDEESLIEFICVMVNKNLMNIKINQQEGLINFGDKDYRADAGEVFDKIMVVTSLINKK
ncbi:26S proteasome regulatory subunit N5 [Enteropsectra breve]|nr:26S proteasome regulatory subunit N5 [Enteropsectra breve]